MVAPGGDVERLADREEADRQRGDLDAVHQFRHPEGEPRLAGEEIDADETEHQAEEEARESADRRRPESGRHGHEGEAHEAK
jgi:hypothetical protein